MSEPRTVTRLPRATKVREEWIELSDGCRLFARVVLPRDAVEDPVPAVLEFLPYRLTDGTAHRDATQHPYFAGHGYAGVRVDMRGSGNSDGVLLDEYLPQEQADACEVIAWLADQPWCQGTVGMYGKSWGGFNGLQVAAHRPPALRAVVSAYSTDDRYADDVHYMGGCVLGHEVLSWATYMLGLGALPPDPRYVGERWRQMWMARLRESPVFLETWLAHQRRDAFWRQGSISEDFGALDCAVLLVGGWADGYTNGFGRALAGLHAAGVPCRGLVGPWSHAWPEVAQPGPRIGFLQVCVRWWDRWLKGIDNDAMEEPLLRAWLQEPVAPAAGHTLRPGRWVGEAHWPSPRITGRRLFPAADGSLGDRPASPGHIEHRGSDLAGADAGAWCPYGRPTDFAPDQAAEDGLAMCFTSPPLAERLEILGMPELELELAADRRLALVAARLCDVSPDGRSLLIARGLCNLTHRAGHDRVDPIVPGEPLSVRFALDFAGHAFPAGHRVRLALSPTYWPFAWPSPEPVTLAVSVGADTRLTLPERPPAQLDDELAPFGEPERAPLPAGDVVTTSERSLVRSLATGRVTTGVVTGESSRLEEIDLAFGERLDSRHQLTEGQPLSARLDVSGEHFLRRPGWEIRVVTRTSLSADAEDFTVTTELDAYEGDVQVHATRRAVRIPRDGN